MGDVVQLFSKTDNSRMPADAGRARPHVKDRADGSLLTVQDDAGLAHLVVRQRVPKHVAKQILKMMSEELLHSVSR